jgi:hypothetical protein
LFIDKAFAVSPKPCAEFDRQSQIFASTRPSNTHPTMGFQLWRTRHDSNMRPSDS